MLCRRATGRTSQVTDRPPGNATSRRRGSLFWAVRLLVAATESGTRTTAPTVPGRMPKVSPILSLLGAWPDGPLKSRVVGGDFFC